MVAHSKSSGVGPELALAAEFPEPTHEQWQAQVQKVLQRSGLVGEHEAGPVEDVLATNTYDGITVHPLYTATAGEPGVPGLAPFVRGARPQGSVAEGWDVRQRHEHPDAAETNREILADLYNGVSSLWLRLGRGGLAVDDLADALEGVHLDMIGVTLDAGADFAAAAEAFLALAEEQGVRGSALRGNLGADPLGWQARTGQPGDREAAIALAERSRAFPELKALVADGLPYHEAGGSDAQELGCSLAAATTYLRWLTDAGLDVDTAAGLLEFRYAATADQFLTIAKLRAARRLWEQVTRACGVAEQARGQVQHAVTSSAMLTRRDPWVNMLRTTIASFAAGVGGAQAVTTLPFDTALGLPDAFARRIARNTQSLLLEESHLAQVIDPAGGSYYVESLTDELAKAAWAWFQRIEAAGGLPAALESGLIADELAATWERRRTAIAHREDPITGVSEFPNLDEPPLEREPAPERPAGGLPAHRYAEDFERLRDAADAQPQRPTVFLATLGPLAAYNARASFARNLFAAGGVECADAGATESTEDVIAAYSGAPVVCLCSSDKVYAERAAETAEALKRAGAQRVLLAGKPGDLAGVDGFVFTGCDALAVLTDVHDQLGVRR
ncbi:heterodimeric methylmalonyl-CoA mutase small subunit [Saccharopolyspora kobensis]|uniref:Heterodimeric methylmalonyl-CoA mutase small subunit n=2 Tax=Saccharopolyspora kobensis TaxID=146035 RepID=A0A1H6C6S3_9PSEU|nr:methylmalonyl-CoA mutase family protein [Saccharopolyspora kobensis]SEG68664.1 heterodimeric methylmalonyl-CoA mutase small subunit [Saccharopolyspora kobensis]SFC30630.1 heterodimeric methylmalonyl-CoA mutase small subunit [Saccharopolyspora kobensis]